MDFKTALKLKNHGYPQKREGEGTHGEIVTRDIDGKLYTVFVPAADELLAEVWCLLKKPKFPLR